MGELWWIVDQALPPDRMTSEARRWLDERLAAAEIPLLPWTAKTACDGAPRRVGGVV